MKRTLLATAAFAALSTAASAADLPRRSVAPVVAAPMFTWTGAYVGVHAGYHMYDSKGIGFTGTDTGAGGLGTVLQLGFIPNPAPGGKDGFLGGLHVGYNYQINQFVVGLEADISLVDSSRGATLAPVPGSGLTTISNRKMEYFGTVRGRLGIAIDRLLIYGTGGLAFGDAKMSFTVASPAAVPPLNASGSASANFGWTVGGGLEYAITNNFTVRGEYLYYDLGNKSSTVIYNYFAFSSSLTGSVNNRGHIARAGLTYKF